jgi:hypothetical protein
VSLVSCFAVVTACSVVLVLYAPVLVDVIGRKAGNGRTGRGLASPEVSADNEIHDAFCDSGWYISFSYMPWNGRRANTGSFGFYLFSQHFLLWTAEFDITSSSRLSSILQSNNDQKLLAGALTVSVVESISV